MSARRLYSACADTGRRYRAGPRLRRAFIEAAFRCDRAGPPDRAAGICASAPERRTGANAGDLRPAGLGRIRVRRACAGMKPFRRDVFAFAAARVCGPAQLS